SVEYGEVEAVPDASLLPVTQPAPAGDTTAAAEFLGQILPGESRLEHEENAGECRPIWDAGTAAFGFGKFRWEQRCDDFPERIADQRFSHILCHIIVNQPGPLPGFIRLSKPEQTHDEPHANERDSQQPR